MNVLSKLIIACLVVTAIFFGLYIIPLGILWSIRTLFDYHIPYNLTTWFAIVFLVAVFNSGAGKA
jgi:hypothetical protein